MKIVVLDPQFSVFGHHVGFNDHVIRLLTAAGATVVFLDIQGGMKANSTSTDVTFVDVTHDVFADGRTGAISAQDFQKCQKDPVKAARLWAWLETFEADAVLMTSEGQHRVGLYCAIPDTLHRKVLVIVHVVWSFLNTLASSAPFRAVVRERVGGVFVLEPFLMDALLAQRLRTYYFPHRVYAGDEIERLLGRRRPEVAAGSRIGTFGVINERRNHNFLIDAIGGMQRIAPVEYFVCGQLMPAVREEVDASVARFKERGIHQIHTCFSYMTDLELEKYLASVDTGLLAYDTRRNLQASGAVYTYAEASIPLVLPRTWLFEQYGLQWPGMFTFYEPLDAASLEERLVELQAATAGWARAFESARERFLQQHALDVAAVYVQGLLARLLTGGQEKGVLSLFSQGNRYYRQHRPVEAEACYLASINSVPGFSEQYRNAITLRRRRDDLVGASCLRELQRVHEGNDTACDGFRLREGNSITVLVWPPFDTQASYDEFLHRFAWHFAPVGHFVDKVIAFRQGDIDKGVVRRPQCMSLESSRATHMFIDKIELLDGPEDAKSRLDDVTFSLVWHYDTPQLRKHPFPSSLTRLYSRPIWRVDEHHERFASSHYLKAVSGLVDLAHSREQAIEKFRTLKAAFTAKKIAVFGTGPSLANAFNESFEGVDTIAANSMVKNHALLEHLRPKLIVCADPIFHAGVSVYAEEFRKLLKAALIRYRCPLLVPERDLHIYHWYFAGTGVDVIPVPLVQQPEPNYRMHEDFFVTSTGNVLTLLLLQIGFSFCDEVDVYGCDGRPESENSYFWGHDKSAQINERMDDIKFAHPGFFDIDYDDYYNEHCETLEKWASAAESIGKTLNSRTFSYIAALKRREANLLVS